MGSGKSSLGRSLALRYELPFYETDAMVESHVGESITSIFQNEGEAAFRCYEQEILHSIPTNTPSIVATGGGLPCFSDNAQWMRAHGFTLYLSLTVKDLTARLAHSHTQRPLLQGKHGASLQAYIAALLAQREPIYRQAHLSIDGNFASPEYLQELFEKQGMPFTD